MSKIEFNLMQKFRRVFDHLKDVIVINQNGYLLLT